MLKHVLFKNLCFSFALTSCAHADLGTWLLASGTLLSMLIRSTFHPQFLVSTMIIRTGYRERQTRLNSCDFLGFSLKSNTST